MLNRLRCFLFGHYWGTNIAYRRVCRRCRAPQKL